jgi:hypothetical protein
VVSAPLPALLSGALVWPLWSSVVSLVAGVAATVTYDELCGLKARRAEATPPPAPAPAT